MARIYVGRWIVMLFISLAIGGNFGYATFGIVGAILGFLGFVLVALTAGRARYLMDGSELPSLWFRPEDE